VNQLWGFGARPFAPPCSRIHEPVVRLRQQKLLMPMATTYVDQIAPAQCRAARSLLDMNQSQLAHASELSLSTVVDFERERRLLSEEAVMAVRNALERAGIKFIDEKGGGAGVRFRKPRRRK
jgi:DNA-binding transcriptional regulator YiaG